MKLLPHIVVALILGWANMVIAQPAFVSPSQFRADFPTLTYYADIQDDRGNAITDITASDIRVTIDGAGVPIVDVQAFRDREEGVAYTVLVDVSGSLRGTPMENVRSSLREMIQGLRPLDVMSIVAFGQTARIVVDFTSDQATLQSAVESLQATEAQTTLFSAIALARKLNQRSESGFPIRRAILTLSDGIDEGSGLTLEDIIVPPGPENYPIYTMGFTPDGKEGIETLKRLSQLTNGHYLSVPSPSAVSEGYETVRDAILRQYVIQATVPEDKHDSYAHSVQIHLSKDGRTLTTPPQAMTFDRLENTPETGSLQVEIIPQGALDAGAKWRVDNGKWLDSGAVAESLSPGSHTVDYSSIPNWLTPLPDKVEISNGETATLSITYTQSGKIEIFIGPEAVRSAGAQWRIDGGEWHTMDDTVWSGPIGTHRIEFSDIDAWTTPDSTTVDTAPGSVTTVTATYKSNRLIDTAFNWLPEGMKEKGLTLVIATVTVFLLILVALTVLIVSNRRNRPKTQGHPPRGDSFMSVDAAPLPPVGGIVRVDDPMDSSGQVQGWSLGTEGQSKPETYEETVAIPEVEFPENAKPDEANPSPPEDGTPVLLIVVDGAASGSELSLRVGTTPVTFGRGTSLGAGLQDNTISASHFELYMEGGRLFIRDLDSRHGTIVNEMTIKNARALEDGDVIQIGNTRLRVHYVGASL